MFNGHVGTNVCPIVREILICNIFRKSIGDDKIALAIVIEIRKMRGPAPLCLMDASQLADFTKRFAICNSIVLMEHVSYILIIITITLVIDVSLVRLIGDGSFFSAVGFGEHVKGYNVWQTIIVIVSSIASHRRMALMANKFFRLI